MEITKEQVLELHSALGYINSNRLKEWFPEAFKVKLEVGKVYRWSTGKAMFKISSINGTSVLGYGFLYDGIYCASMGILTTNHDVCKEATTEEWESALIEEAKKKGYKNGNYECLSSFGSDIVDTDNYFVECDGYLYQGKRFSDANLIFKDGVWAEIIKTFSKEEAEKLLGGKII